MERPEDEIPSNLPLGKSLGMVLERDLATDITFKIGEEKVEMKAHKIILMGRSPVFRAMFNGPLAEKTDVTIPDTDQHSFSVFLRYCYTDEVRIEENLDKLDGIFHLADKYQVDSMKAVCTGAIEPLISKENAIAIYNLSFTYRFEELQDEAYSYVSMNTTRCIESPDFLNIDQRVLHYLASNSGLEVVESFLLQRILDWAIEECKRKSMTESQENLRTVLGTTLREIHFMSIPDKVFHENSLLKQILTEDEVNELHFLYGMSKRNGRLRGEIFKTTPRNNNDYYDVYLCQVNTDSIASSTFGTRPKNGICLEVSGPLWLFGAIVFKGKSMDQYMAARLRILEVKEERRSLQTVEIVEFCSTHFYEIRQNTMEIIFPDPVRMVPDSKYALELVSFCTARDRAMWEGQNAVNSLDFCNETITFSAYTEDDFAFSSSAFAGLLLQGMKERSLESISEEN